MLKAIILDFDGVIAESVAVKTDAFAELYQPYGKEVVERVLRHHCANGGMSRFEKFNLYHREYLNTILTGKEVDKLSQKFSRLVVEKVVSAPYVPGAFEFIRQNHNRFKMFVSTGTPIEEMKTILKRRNLYGYFRGVYGSPEKKTVHISRISTEYDFKPDDMLFIGDAVTDMDASTENKVPFVLRVHKENRELLDGYMGKKISDLRELNVVPYMSL